MRTLPAGFTPYRWAESTEEIAARCGFDPIEIIRFDANVPPRPPASSRPAAVAGAVADVNGYPHGGYPRLAGAIADYAGVEPKNIVLGAGADDLILLCARAYAGQGDMVRIADEPTYPLYRVAAGLAGAEVGGDDPALTFCCRPNNPTGELGDLPASRPLVVDEAYFEYAGQTAAGRLEEGLVVVRTFSKAFGLAGARVGYAIAEEGTAAELNRRQAPAPISTLSAALASAALATPPDVTPQLEERERFTRELRSMGLAPYPSHANFVFVTVDDPYGLRERLLSRGLVIRALPEGVRITIRDEEDDDLLLDAVSQSLGHDGRDGRAERDGARGRRVRHVRTTVETTVRVRLDVDSGRRARVDTGAGIYDHFLEQLAFHAGLDLVLEAAGDFETGVHHTAEDAALALGEALDRALGERRGIARYGDVVVPMDEAVARAAIDLGGRPWSEIDLERDVGLGAHILGSFARAGRLGLHVTATGRDDHHVTEAAFKAVGRALGAALLRDGDEIPSTKGTL